MAWVMVSFLAFFLACIAWAFGDGFWDGPAAATIPIVGMLLSRVYALKKELAEMHQRNYFAWNDLFSRPE